MKKFLFFSAVLAASLLISQPVLALDLGAGSGPGTLNAAAGNAGYALDASIEGTIGSLIAVILGLLGVLFLILTVYAGFLWMTAAGNDKQVGTAKNILATSIVGLVIIMAAYSISRFVIIQIQNAT